ncbi:MAG TPA: hypothetical protein VJB66_00655 [Candidatus Nanoarchaeia archaeon]|nr:hypothetical protein [Candidatus Nanoarchaeia archaeon]
MAWTARDVAEAVGAGALAAAGLFTVWYNWNPSETIRRGGVETSYEIQDDWGARAVPVWHEYLGLVGYNNSTSAQKGTQIRADAKEFVDKNYNNVVELSELIDEAGTKGPLAGERREYARQRGFPRTYTTEGPYILQEGRDAEALEKAEKLHTATDTRTR